MPDGGHGGGTVGDFSQCVNGEIVSLMEDFGEKGVPFDYAGMALSIERSLVQNGGANLDPPDPDYWTAVAVELRRRASASRVLELELPAVLNARLRAVERLVVELLKRDPDTLEALAAERAEPLPPKAPEWREIQRAAEGALLTRARHPDGLLAPDD